MARLVFENVSVRYPIYNARAQSLRHQFMRIATGGKIAAEAGHTVSVTALDGVSFELNSGDSVGLIGHNGAGKSTLLRTMAGIYTPDSGRVIREGRVATVLEIGSGMDPELSGYENILRMGMLMGMSLKEARSKIPSIEEFTELGDFLSLPVRTYSSGMTMRLMFAVATSHQPDILLVDEMFSTGDAGFQEKAKARMHELIANAEIFVFASHDHAAMAELCDKVYELSHGKIYPRTAGSGAHIGANNNAGKFDHYLSLGDNCEVALQLVRYGYEESSFFRYVSCDIHSLLKVLASDFSGVYHFDNLVPHADDMVLDVRYGISFHSEMRSRAYEGGRRFLEGEDKRRKIHEKEISKISHLINKWRNQISKEESVLYFIKSSCVIDAHQFNRLFEYIDPAGGGKVRLVNLIDREVESPVEDERLLYERVSRFAPFDQANNAVISEYDALFKKYGL